MITVEGLDGSGKTFLVGQLCKDFPQLKHTPSIGNKHDLNQIVEQSHYIAEEAQIDEIWDRSRIISEFIYNPILKGRELAFGWRTYLALLGIWLEQPQLLIYCNRPLDKIEEVFDEKEQLKGVKESLPEIERAYDHTMGFLSILFSVTDPPKYLIEYDWAEDSYEALRDIVARYLVEAKELSEVRI